MDKGEEGCPGPTRGTFKLSENGSVLSVENVRCMTCYKAFAYHGSNISLIHVHMTAHPIHVFLILTKIND